jgi:hypothetical protein
VFEVEYGTHENSKNSTRHVTLSKDYPERDVKEHGLHLPILHLDRGLTKEERHFLASKFTVSELNEMVNVRYAVDPQRYDKMSKKELVQEFRYPRYDDFDEESDSEDEDSEESDSEDEDSEESDSEDEDSEESDSEDEDSEESDSEDEDSEESDSEEEDEGVDEEDEDALYNFPQTKLSKNINSLLKQLESLAQKLYDVDGNDDFLDKLYDPPKNARLTMRSVLSLHNMRHDRKKWKFIPNIYLLVVPPQAYNRVMKLSPKNFMFSEKEVSKKNGRLVQVGYFHSGTSGFAYSGDGGDYGDLYWLVTESLRRWLIRILKQGEKYLKRQRMIRDIKRINPHINDP